MPEPREVIAEWLRSRYPQTKTGQPALVSDAWLRDAQDLVAALTEHGYRIVSAQTMVTIPLSAAIHLQQVMHQSIRDEGGRQERAPGEEPWTIDILTAAIAEAWQPSAIAAAQATDAGDGA